MPELTTQQIERQDKVDNGIHDLIQALSPSGQEIDWDIEMIGDVRDVIEYYLTKRLRVCTEQEFYPYLQE